MTYIQPLLLLVAAVLFAGLLRFSPGRPKRYLFCGFLGLIAISWPPFEWLCGLPLERACAPRSFEPPADIGAIVVLASSIRPPEYWRPYSVPDPDTFARCEHAAWLYRRVNAPVLACEGAAAGRVIAELLRRAGVRPESISIEGRSRSTHENALFGAAILRGRGIRRIALVVDARSMLRAAACFRKQGIEVVPAPSDVRTLGSWIDELLPGWNAVRRNEITLHEAVGLAWYKMRGWI